MIIILDRHNRHFKCYADKQLIEKQINWATVSPELKRFYRDMAAKGIREFAAWKRRI